MIVLKMSYDDMVTMSSPIVFGVCSIPVTLLFRPMIYMVSTRYMTSLNRNVTGTEQMHRVLDIVTTGIRQM